MFITYNYRSILKNKKGGNAHTASASCPYCCIVQAFVRVNLAYSPPRSPDTIFVNSIISPISNLLPTMWELLDPPKMKRASSRAHISYSPGLIFSNPETLIQWPFGSLSPKRTTPNACHWNACPVAVRILMSGVTFLDVKSEIS